MEQSRAGPRNDVKKNSTELQLSFIAGYTSLPNKSQKGFWPFLKWAVPEGEQTYQKFLQYL